MKTPFFPQSGADMSGYGELWSPRLYQAGEVPLDPGNDPGRFAVIGDMVFFSGVFRPRKAGTTSNPIYIELPMPVPRSADSTNDQSNGLMLGTALYLRPGTVDYQAYISAPNLGNASVIPPGDRWAYFWATGKGALGGATTAFAVATTDLITCTGFYFTRPTTRRA